MGARKKTTKRESNGAGESLGNDKGSDHLSKACQSEVKRSSMIVGADEIEVINLQERETEKKLEKAKEEEKVPFTQEKQRKSRIHKSRARLRKIRKSLGKDKTGGDKAPLRSQPENEGPKKQTRKSNRSNDSEAEDTDDDRSICSQYSSRSFISLRLIKRSQKKSHNEKFNDDGKDEASSRSGSSNKRSIKVKRNKGINDASKKGRSKKEGEAISLLRVDDEKCYDDDDELNSIISGGSANRNLSYAGDSDCSSEFEGSTTFEISDDELTYNTYKPSLCQDFRDVRDYWSRSLDEMIGCVFLVE